MPPQVCYLAQLEMKQTGQPLKKDVLVSYGAESYLSVVKV